MKYRETTFFRLPFLKKKMLSTFPLPSGPLTSDDDNELHHVSSSVLHIVFTSMIPIGETCDVAQLTTKRCTELAWHEFVVSVWIDATVAVPCWRSYNTVISFGTGREVMIIKREGAYLYTHYYSTHDAL